ncbi:PhnB protein [Okibacterium sp. HSC-33S16]|uniref:VOC family protein n=1 Tax=Okibacterium sp. HSC-33S16 TaxID=2910965 RepID=UPI0020A0428C|nr:VOC family protein [Okibacterium sp. HSC-33S16]MCP2031838.1 PhnB protein [Okibacterium sp. HSC-33S16]
MSVVLNPYLHFESTAREAMTFYASVFGGTLTLNTFADFGGSGDPDDDEKIMHGQIDAPNGLVLMGSDIPAGMESSGSNGSISLSGDDETALTGFFEGLATGGTISEPLTRAPWGDSFGMLVDRFGVEWLVNISGAAAAAESNSPDSM